MLYPGPHASSSLSSWYPVELVFDGSAYDGGGLRDRRLGVEPVPVISTIGAVSANFALAATVYRGSAPCFARSLWRILAAQLSR